MANFSQSVNRAIRFLCLIVTAVLLLAGTLACPASPREGSAPQAATTPQATAKESTASTDAATPPLANALSLEIEGPGRRLGIFVNGLVTGEKAPARIHVKPGDLVSLASMVEPGITVFLVDEGEVHQTGAWVVQGDERFLYFSAESIEEGAFLQINTGTGWRNVGLDLNRETPPKRIKNLISGTDPLCALFVDRRKRPMTPFIQKGQALWVLDLSQTPLADAAPLAGFTELRSLNLSGTAVSSLSALRNLRHLRVLDLHATGVGELNPLAGMVALRKLDLSRTPVASVADLSAMHELVWLNLSRTAVADLAPLGEAVALRKLFLGETQVNDLSALSRLRRLEVLDLAETPVADIAPLSGMSRLRMLDLRHTNVADVSALATLESLEQVNLSGAPVTDLFALAGLSSLLKLNLSGTPVQDIEPLFALTNLIWLSLSRTNVQAADVDRLREKLPNCRIVMGKQTPPAPQP